MYMFYGVFFFFLYVFNVYVQSGQDRQEVHEVIRVLSQESAFQVKQLGKDNDLLDRIKGYKGRALAMKERGEESEKQEETQEEASFSLPYDNPDIFDSLGENWEDDVLNPSLFIGRSEEQVIAFLDQEINPILERCHEDASHRGGEDSIQV